MISQRSVRVKHKAEVKDKHNSCVLSASGDEPNLTSRTAAWQPEINAFAPPPLQCCAWDFFFSFWKFLSYSIFFFFFFWTLPLVVVDVFRESSLRQKTFAHCGGSTATKTSGNHPPRAPFESLHIMKCSDVQDQRNKYGPVAICVVGEREKKFRWKIEKKAVEKCSYTRI